MPRLTTLTANHFTTSANGEGQVYAAEFSDAKGQAQTLTLDPEMVELAVLNKAEFDMTLRADGSVTLDAMGLPEAVIAKARDSGYFIDCDLVTLVKACIDPTLLRLEEDPKLALGQLQEQLQHCLNLVDAAIKTLS